jgi:protocatechuate 3,4-dioxygenase beta subunit
MAAPAASAGHLKSAISSSRTAAGTSMRSFCLVLSLTLLAAPLLAREPSRIAPHDAPSSADVAAPGEPGDRLEVTGVVYAADGRTPIAGASVYVYQTDARGYYRPDDAMGNRDPRLRALLRTDARGRYAFRTIRPGSYPGTRVPKHIHYEVTAPGHGTRIFEIVFEDDPFVGPRVRADAARPGSCYSLRPVRRGADGIGRVEQDVVVPAR